MVDQLIRLFETGVTPVIERHGSVGASNLIPLSAIARLLMGEGMAYLLGEPVTASRALEAAGLQAAPMTMKEGLATVTNPS